MDTDSEDVNKDSGHVNNVSWDVNKVGPKVGTEPRLIVAFRDRASELEQKAALDNFSGFLLARGGNPMPQKAVSMRQSKEVLRWRYDLGVLQSQIARSCSISQSSVNRYLERASAAGLRWPLPEDCDDRQLNELLALVAFRHR